MTQIQQKEAQSADQLDRRISVAPMMGWTDRHDRYFLRLIAPNTLLYTVMLTSGALIHGDHEYFLKFHDAEHPVALQLGGSDPNDLATSAKLGEIAGYDEINLNCGCPSDRVQRGSFGACLMKEPELVADCIDAMRQKVDVPVTVKNRIGIDDLDNYSFVQDFVGTVSEKGGCETFIVHARKAWLTGLSPKDNRTIPPLKWEVVHQLKKDFPHLKFILNGGLTCYEDIAEQLPHVDGVMIGREAYQNPYFLSELEHKILGTNKKNLRSRHDVIKDLMPYIEQEMSQGLPLKDITRHILGLFQGMKGAKKWRRTLSEQAHKKDANSAIVKDALAHIIDSGL